MRLPVLDLRALQSLVAILDTASFTRAAEQVSGWSWLMMQASPLAPITRPPSLISGQQVPAACMESCSPA